MKKFRNERGFTVVELLVTILVIGILVAVAAPLYAGVQEKAKEAAHEANVKNLHNAATMYLLDGGGDVIWSPFAGEVAKEPQAYHESWMLYLDRWPPNPFGGTYSVEIKDGKATVSPGR